MTFDFRRLFNSPVKQTIVVPSNDALRGEPNLSGAPAETTTEKTQGVFLTAQSVLTFPGATAAVLLIWHVAGYLNPEWAASRWTPFVLSMLTGAFIYGVGVTDPNTVMSKRDKVIAVPLAFLNALQVFAAVIGIPLSPGKNG
ncbi:MAG TPA: hypothetical protein VFQ87_07690 [Bradyrhizobium sp.]|jgi:hypothetical protein|nr:hypothetical protein [Bradyrhizobium sp.]